MCDFVSQLRLRHTSNLLDELTHHVRPRAATSTATTPASSPSSKTTRTSDYAGYRPTHWRSTRPGAPPWPSPLTCLPGYDTSPSTTTPNYVKPPPPPCAAPYSTSPPDWSTAPASASSACATTTPTRPTSWTQPVVATPPLGVGFVVSVLRLGVDGAGGQPGQAVAWPWFACP